MVNVVILAVCIAVRLSLAQQSPVQQLPSIQLPRDLDRVLTDLESAYRKRDADTLSKLFAEDDFVLAGQNPPVRGRDAIK